MYRVTLATDDKPIVVDEHEHTYATIDAAITAAKALTGPKGPCFRTVVRDGARMRVVSTSGQAHWVKKCKACGGTGVLAGQGGFYGPPQCEPCRGLGHIEDLPA